MVRIKLDNVSKFFGKVKAVEDLKLDIKDSEFVALLGPSGCGKTTTLLMIAGIYKPTRGRIYFDDVDVTDLPPKDRNVGMVFQSYALYPHMKVYDNIAFPLKLKKFPKHEIDRRVREVAKLLRIEDLLDRYPRQLSGGQQQRVALGRALVKEPDVLLLDEPLSNLDAALRVVMRAELKRLQKELGITTVYVTHDQVEALSMANRIAVLNAGRLQQYAPPEELYNHPANLFVASFIGNPPMNFVEGEVRLDREGYYFDMGYFRIPLDKELGSLLYSKAKEVIMGFRPEYTKLLFKEEPGAIPGTVYVVEPLGRDLIVHVKLNGDIVKVIAPPMTKVEVGRRVWIAPVRERIHFFDKKSGKAII